MESQDTTATGVVEAPSKPLSQREQAMQSILQASAPVPDAAPEPPEDDTTPATEPESVTLKIDGTEVLVPREKVHEAGIRALQKESAADKRLREASEKERSLLAREEELKRMEEALLKQRDQQADDSGREFVDAVFSDPDAAAGHISTLTRQVQGVVEKLDRVEKTEAQRLQDEQQRLVNHYHSKYGDIASDEVMNFALNQFRRQVAAEDPTLNPMQVVDKAAERVYQKFNVTPVAPELTDAEKRKLAKERMPAPARQASGRTPPKPEEKPKTPAQVIDEMRLGRGPRAY